MINIRKIGESERDFSIESWRILVDYLGVNIENAITAEFIGTPGNYMEQYLVEFSYKNSVRISTG